MATLTAQRLALHGVGRLRGEEVVEWARRALELAGPDDPVRVEAAALLGLGLGWVVQPGCPAPHADGGRRAGRPEPARHSRAMSTRTATRAAVASAVHEPTHAGSVWFAVWSYVWLARAEFVVGAWDEAAAGCGAGGVVVGGVGA